MKMSVFVRGPVALKNVPLKPVMSSSPAEARRRVLALYKQWYRAVPTIVHSYNLPYTQQKVRSRIREEFLKNSHVRDVRAIDLLIIKGEMELQETVLKWSQSCHIKEYFKKETAIEQPTDFLGKFFAQK